MQHILQLHQVDVTTASLNGKLEEEGFVTLLTDEESVRPEAVTTMLEYCLLKGLGFVQVESDPCIHRASSGEPIFIGVYVDDIVMAQEQGTTHRSKAVPCQEVGYQGPRKATALPRNENRPRRIHWKSVGWAANVHGKPAEEVWKESGKPVATPVDSSGKLMKATVNDGCIDQQNIDQLLEVYCTCPWPPEIRHIRHQHCCNVLFTSTLESGKA